MSAGIVLDPGFTTPEMARVFSPARRVAAMLEFEAALAQALADVGLAPEGEVAAVVAACQEPIVEPEALLATTWESGTPLIALVAEIEHRLDGRAGRRWVHHGATTQDVIDTTHMLLARDGLDLIEGDLSRIARVMHELVIRHRSQPQIGRTFLQYARPTTFGFRVATWLDATLHHIDRTRDVVANLTVQFGGAVGNLAEIGRPGYNVVDALARRLSLSVPDVSWHADRSRIRALAAAVEQPTRTMAKVAMDVALLTQSDTAELQVRSGGSSTMSEKRNPIDSVRVLAAADLCSGAAGMLTGARPHELDRGIGSWHLEWAALPLLFQSGAAALAGTARCLESLTVDSERMSARVATGSVNDERDAGQIDRVISHYDRTVGG